MTDRTAVTQLAIHFGRNLQAVKASISEEPAYWYPYPILSMFEHIQALLRDTENKEFLSALHRATIADIGCADGDLAYFLESLGHTVDAIDYSVTRGPHGLEPTRRLGSALKSAVEVHDVNLDAQFWLPRERYDVAFFMGILYHLKNPYCVLEALSERTKYCFLSTRVARFTPSGTPIRDEPLVYILDSHEANADDTNYWIFSEASLRRLLYRTGWEVRAFITRGDIATSNPSDALNDERAYCLLESGRERKRLRESRFTCGGASRVL